MTDFIEQAEEALEDADFWGSAAFAPNLKTLLRQAITEVRERDERLSGQDFAIDELKVALKEENAACKRLEAENANLKLRIEAENEADNEMHAIHKARIEALEGQVQVADMLANKLKAENAKLREDTPRGNEPHKENTND